MSKMIPDGVTRQHIVEAIRDLDKGVDHPFGESTGYDVLFEGRRYPPKAVVGLAVGKLTGRSLGPYDFKGGLRSKCFQVLEGHGFEIISKGETSGLRFRLQDNLWRARRGIHSCSPYRAASANREVLCC
jgi:5-methylcytosine-specific restriction protein A